MRTVYTIHSGGQSEGDRVVTHFAFETRELAEAWIEDRVRELTPKDQQLYRRLRAWSDWYDVRYSYWIEELRVYNKTRTRKVAWPPRLP